jgi:hypothetical protein
MSDILDEDIRWIQKGEPHDGEVYNRPTRDLKTEVNTKLSEASQEAIDNSIVYSIALG